MRLLALFLLLAVLAVPVEAQIQNPNTSTPTTLYFHLAGLQDYPINTQAPAETYEDSVGKGLFTHSLSCVPEPVPGIARGSHHTVYGFSTPGYVHYDRMVGGIPYHHPERGISYDVQLDTTQAFTLHWFLETQAVGTDHDVNALPVVVPNVVVKATMRLGDDISVGAEAFNTGQVVAEGLAGPALLYPGTTDAAYSEVGGRHVYGFSLPMHYQFDRIPRDESYNVRIDVFVENPLCTADASIMPNAVRVHSSPGHRPHMELAILNPLVIDHLHPQFIGDELVVHSAVNAAWGNYDVDLSTLRLDLEGGTPARAVDRIVVNLEHVMGHDNHQEPIQVTWVWRHLEDGAQPGVYTVRLTAHNDQGTATAVAESRFRIGAGCTDEEACQTTALPERAGVPGLGALALLAALGIALRVTPAHEPLNRARQ